MFTKRKKMDLKRVTLLRAMGAILFVGLSNFGYVVTQDAHNFFFAPPGHGRFVPSFPSNRNALFSSGGSFQPPFRSGLHNGAPGSYQEQTLFVGDDEATAAGGPPFSPFQSTRSPDFFSEISSRNFNGVSATGGSASGGAIGTIPSASFQRPQIIRPNGGSGFVPHKSGGRANVPHQQGQFLAHFNEQTHLPSGLSSEKPTTQSSRVIRPFGGSFSRNRPVGSFNRQSTEDLYQNQQQQQQQQQKLPYRSNRSRFQPSGAAERTTTTTTTTTEKTVEKVSRFNRFGSTRSSPQTSPKIVPSVPSVASLERLRPNKTLFQPRRPVFISREVNEPVHLKNQVSPSKITINHNGSSNDNDENTSNNSSSSSGNDNNREVEPEEKSHEDVSLLEEEINEGNYVQEKPVTENVKDIPVVDGLEKLSLFESNTNNTSYQTREDALQDNVSLAETNSGIEISRSNSDTNSSILNSNLIKATNSSEIIMNEDLEEKESPHENQNNSTQKPDYEYEYEDYEEKSSTIPSSSEVPASVKTEESSQNENDTNINEETSRVLNINKNSDAIDASAENLSDDVISNNNTDETGETSEEYYEEDPEEGDELDEEDGELEDDSDYISHEEEKHSLEESELQSSDENRKFGSQENPQNVNSTTVEQNQSIQQNPEDIVGQAVVQVITTKSVINGSTAYPQDESSSTASAEEDTSVPSENNTSENPINRTVEAAQAESSNDEEGVNNTTESYVVVASIQTSRSISGARFLPFPAIEQEEKKQTLSELERKIHEQKNKNAANKKITSSDQQETDRNDSSENDSPMDNEKDITTDSSQGITTTTDDILVETTTEKTITNQSASTESIIDKLDRVQSELSSGLLTGKFPILNEMQDIETSPILSSTASTPKAVVISTTSAPTNSSIVGTTSNSKFIPNIRKFTPKTTTSKPDKKINIESVPMDDLSGLLPAGFKRPQNSYRNRKITTTTTTTTTPQPPKDILETSVQKPFRNLTTGRSFKNSPVNAQEVIAAGLLPRGYKTNITTTTAATETTTEGGASNQSKSIKDLLSKIKFEDNLDKLLPKDYKEKINKSTTDSPAPVTVIEDISKFLPPGYKHPASTTTTTTKPLQKIPIKDDISHLLPPAYKEENILNSTINKNPSGSIPLQDNISKFLPPGFKLDSNSKDSDAGGLIDISKLLPKDYKPDSNEKPPAVDDILKKIEFKDVSSLLPSDYKENATSEEDTMTLTTEKSDGSGGAGGLKVIFPKGVHKRPGGRWTTPKSSGAEGPPPPQIVIKKGPPTRATTEFTGWPTPSTTPISIEKLLEQQRTSTIDPFEFFSSSTTTTTTTTTTVEPPKPTEPGVCRHECDLAGTIKIVEGVTWKPELLDHNTDEWKNLAREVEAQLNEVYSSAPHLRKWYKKVRIDSFSKGSVLVDYFVELSNITQQVDTREIKKLFHEALVMTPLPVAPLPESDENEDLNSSEDEAAKGEKLVKETYLLGRFVVDPVSTDFIVIPKSISPVVEYAEEDVLLPQWAIVVIVIGVGSLCFIVVFGVTVLINRQKRAKKTPTPLTNDMLHELNKNHMGGIDNYGVDDFYNVDDAWGDTKQPIKPKRFTNSMHGSSASNIYDSWRSQRGGDYYYDNHNYSPHKIDPYPPDAFSDAHQMYTYNPRARYHRDYDPDF